MERIDLKRLFEMLKEEGVDFFDEKTCLPKDHWVCPNGCTNYRKKRLIEKIYMMLGVGPLRMNYYYPKKRPSCEHEWCVNPKCYSLAEKRGGKGNRVDQDLVELAEELDLAEWKRLGTEAYFEQFNEQQPPCFRVDENTFRKALDWKKGHEL